MSEKKREVNAFGKRNPFTSIIKGNIGIIAVLIIMCVIVSIATDKFLTTNNIISVLRQISINTYIALGMTLVIILGHIDLSVGSIVAMSGTLTVGLTVNQGMPLIVAIIIGLAVGTLAGFISGFIVSHFKVPAFIITMAMMNIASGIAYVYTGGQSTRITDKMFIAIGTGYLFNVIPLPGALAAFAGLVLCSRMYSGQPSVGSGYELDAIAACVLGGTSMTGGKGRISGTVFGAMVIGIISNGLNLIGVSSYWQLIIKGLIIACAVLLDCQKDKIALLKNKVRAAK